MPPSYRNRVALSPCMLLAGWLQTQTAPPRACWSARRSGRCAGARATRRRRWAGAPAGWGLAPNPVKHCCRAHPSPSPIRPSSPLQFNFVKDIARNPELARAARAALSSSPAGGGGPLAGAAGPPGALQHLQFGAELDSLTAVIDSLDRDAGEESRINQQMASAALGRLQSGRAAAERTLGVLQARGWVVGSLELGADCRRCCHTTPALACCCAANCSSPRLSHAAARACPSAAP